MNIRLTQLDGKLPNLALMRLGAYWKQRGADVYFTRSPYRQLDEPLHYAHVYGSAIFAFSSERVAAFRMEFPEAAIGGTWNPAEPVTLEDILPDIGSDADYSLYPGFTGSIGFTQRGCRLKCGFCVVPKKEGRARSVASIFEIWRGAPWPRHLHLLDNDFFGQEREQWQERLREIRHGGFKVCLNQGINIRMIDDEAAAALASVDYRADDFKSKRIYTAWDNIGDEQRFFSGIETLRRHGIPSAHVMAYMLIGYDRRETWERLFHRYNAMTALGIRPYPMLFEPTRIRGLAAGSPDYDVLVRRGMTLNQFQRWVNGRYYSVTSFADFERGARTAVGKELQKRQTDLWISNP